MRELVTSRQGVDKVSIVERAGGQLAINVSRISVRDLLRVQFPTCGAPVNEVCRTRSDHRQTGYHITRYRRAGLMK